MNFSFIAIRVMLICFLLSACRPETLAPEELAVYVANPNNGLRQIQQIQDTEISVSYQPIDLLISRDVTSTTPAVVLDSLRRKYTQASYFLVAISHNHREVLQPQEGFSDYSSLLQTLAFQMRDYTLLITSNGDTLRPTNYYLDRTYASANASQLLFAFPSLPPTGEWDFRLREFGLGTGNLSFHFDARRAQRSPRLTLN